MNEREEDDDLEAELGLFNPEKPITIDENVSITPKIPQNLNERNHSYDISEEKLLTAAAQLVDVYNKRTKATASATITVQNKSAPEASRSRTVNVNKSSIRSKFAHPIPNFVVTKITEKSSNAVLNKDSSLNVAKRSNPVKIVHRTRLEDIERTKRMVAIQRQKSLQIFNTFAPNAMKNLDRKKLTQPNIAYNTTNFQVKSMNISSKHTGNIDNAERSRMTTTATNANTSATATATITTKRFPTAQTNQLSKKEPVILNFRKKVHELPSKPKSKPAEIFPNNGRNSDSSYRVLEISPVPKNVTTPVPKNDYKDIVTPKITDRFFTNRSQFRSYKTLPKDYSRSPSNRNSGFRSKLSARPIVKKFPSMSNLSNDDKPSTDSKNVYGAIGLKKSNSCIILGEKCNKMIFEQTLQNSTDCMKLYEICSDVVVELCYKPQTVRRKKGRPKKKNYVRMTRDLLNTPEFSFKADLKRIREWPLDGKSSLIANRKRNRRCAFLSIEPMITSIESTLRKTREKSPVSSFQINRLPIKTYSRANLIQPRVTMNNKRFEKQTYAPPSIPTPPPTQQQSQSQPQPQPKPQIQLLNIEPLSSTSRIDLNLKEDIKIEELKGEVSQSTEYIVNGLFDSYDYDLSDAIYVEYLEDTDEIESPAYEPLMTDAVDNPTSIVTGEADTTMETYSQLRMSWERNRPKKSHSVTHNFSATTSVNEKGSPQIEVKYLNTNESDAHSTTDSITEIYAVCDEDDGKTDILSTAGTMQKKVDLILSPIRKSTRKRKIPSEFPNFAKKVRS